VHALAVLDETSVLDEQPMDVATDDDDYDVGLTFQLVRAGSSKSKDLLTDSAYEAYEEQVDQILALCGSQQEHNLPCYGD